MNINRLKHTLHNDTETYLDTLLENSFLHLITLSTRIGHNSATILDHISTNIADDSFDSGLNVSDISDHFPVFFIRHFISKFVEKSPYSKLESLTLILLSNSKKC